MIYDLFWPSPHTFSIERRITYTFSSQVPHSQIGLVKRLTNETFWQHACEVLFSWWIWKPLISPIKRIYKLVNNFSQRIIYEGMIYDFPLLLLHHHLRMYEYEQGWECGNFLLINIQSTIVVITCSVCRNLWWLSTIWLVFIIRGEHSISVPFILLRM